MLSSFLNLQAGKGRTGLMVCTYLGYTGRSLSPSQLCYVGYWEKILSFPSEVSNGPQDVNFPQPCSRELRRIRLYDTVNTTSVFFVVSELQEIPNQMYRPPVEIAKSCSREIKKGYEANSSPRYFLSFVEGNEERITSESEEPRVVVQMDTQNPVLYQKTCLDYHFNKPVQVGDFPRLVLNLYCLLCYDVSYQIQS
ncbi:hypothetical protein REPUB_Repub10bG0055000 [Reevesia pubescens]